MSEKIRKSKPGQLDTLVDLSENKEEVHPHVAAGLGNIVVAHLVYSADDTETATFTLVAGNDTKRRSNDSIARRSVDSPLGKSVIKREAGENSFFLTPDGAVVGVEIRSVKPTEEE